MLNVVKEVIERSGSRTSWPPIREKLDKEKHCKVNAAVERDGKYEESGRRHSSGRTGSLIRIELRGIFLCDDRRHRQKTEEENSYLRTRLVFATIGPGW